MSHETELGLGILMHIFMVLIKLKLCAYPSVLYMQNSVSKTACAPDSQHNIQSVPTCSQISFKSLIPELISCMLENFHFVCL